MEDGIWCFKECGFCRKEVNSETFCNIDPGDIIDWAHNLLDFIDTNVSNIGGIPRRYFISCDNAAYASDCIAPRKGGKYFNSKQHKKDLLFYVVNDIAHFMILHTIKRTKNKNKGSTTLTFLSLEDIFNFRNSSAHQYKISTFHALLGAIDILS